MNRQHQIYGNNALCIVNIKTLIGENKHMDSRHALCTYIYYAYNMIYVPIYMHTCKPYIYLTRLANSISGDCVRIH